MLDDKLAATDWEATQDALLQQIARESYLQWLCEKNQQSKDNLTVPWTDSSISFGAPQFTPSGDSLTCAEEKWPWYCSVPLTLSHLTTSLITYFSLHFPDHYQPWQDHPGDKHLTTTQGLYSASFGRLALIQWRWLHREREKRGNRKLMLKKCYYSAQLLVVNNQLLTSPLYAHTHTCSLAQFHRRVTNLITAHS